ncbi:exodeoxyribonuclease III [Patescibacteria group bacterium]|nr:exodeoxyribonuclease III [Patescibacteria group bacterium]
MQILSWNVNGIRAIARKNGLDWFHQEKPDILCIQETKVHESDLPNEIKYIDGYHSYFSSAIKKGYSGVAIYTKKKPKSVQRGFGIDRFDSEGRVLIADFDDFVLLNIYYPNGKASASRLEYKMDFYDTFLNYVDEFAAEGRKIIICGDVNTAHKEIDLAHPRQNSIYSGFLPVERNWIDNFLSHGYLDTLRVFHQEPELYSWWDYKTRARERNIGWRIDYFFISENLRKNLKEAYIRTDIFGSDHCPVGITLEI